MGIKIDDMKLINEETYKDISIKSYGKYDGEEGREHVAIVSYSEKPDGTQSTISYNVVYKDDFIRKYLFFKKTNPKSFKERVSEQIENDVTYFIKKIEYHEKNKEMTEGLLDSLDKL